MCNAPFCSCLLLFNFPGAIPPVIISDVLRAKWNTSTTVTVRASVSLNLTLSKFELHSMTGVKARDIRVVRNIPHVLHITWTPSEKSPPDDLRITVVATDNRNPKPLTTLQTIRVTLCSCSGRCIAQPFPEVLAKPFTRIPCQSCGQGEISKHDCSPVRN